MTGKTRPNILLVMTDQQRFDTIQALGSRFDAKTPNMDFLASQGIAFDNCFCTAPICSPSRATLMSGIYPSQAGMPGNLYSPCPPMSPTVTALGHCFRSAGYETVYHGKWHLGGDIHHHGFDIAEELSHDEGTRHAAARFWDNRDWCMNKRPFLHVVSFLDPHDHYFFDPEQTDDSYQRPWANAKRDADGLPATIAKKRVEWDESRWGAYVRFYEQRIERVDAEIGRLIDDFRCAGYLANTWIIFTADHGDMAGEHDIPFKGSFMFDGVVRVPLIIVPPVTRILGDNTRKIKNAGIASGRRSQLCSLIDMVPTMLDLAGIDIPDYLPGKSLVPVLEDEETGAPHETVFAEWHTPPIRMARSKEWKYVRHLDGGEELYDLREDANELNNLAAADAVADAKRQISVALDQHLESTRDPFNDLGQHQFVWNPPPEAL